MSDKQLVAAIFGSIIAAILGWNVYARAIARRGRATAPRGLIRPTPAVWLLLGVSLLFIAILLWSGSLSHR